MNQDNHKFDGFSVIISNMLRAFLYIFSFLIFSVSICFAQQTKTVTVIISDPSSVSLESLFSQADLVAFVEIRSGDAENYNHTLYKAAVLKSYKGSKEREVIYFAPFIGYAVGTEYLVFLRKTDKRIGDVIDENAKNKTLPYDATQNFYQIMYDGYSVMPVSFECIFEKPSHQTCQYAVKFNINQVILPKKLKTFPEEKNDEVLDAKYVKRTAIEPVLEVLKGNRK